MRTTRVCIFLLAFIGAGILNGQSPVPIENCPNPITNIVIDDPEFDCVDLFSLAEYPTSSAGEVRWYATGASATGSSMDTRPISQFDSAPFFFGLSKVIFVAPDGLGGTSECSTIVFVSEEANLPTTTCDPITVDLGGACSGEAMVPFSSVRINTDVCAPNDIDSVSLSWTMASMGPPQRTLVVNAHSGNPSFYSLFLRKWVDATPIRELSCLVQINVINEPMAALICPSTQTIAVAPGCTAAYTYDVLGASTAPCNGSIDQTMGDPSGTPLAAGIYDYEFELVDLQDPNDPDDDMMDVCNWTVTVEESNTASTQLTCIADLNVSIDQNCEAILEIPAILTGNTCLPTAQLMLRAVINGVEQEGTTLTFTEANVGQSIDVSVIGPNGLNSCWGTVNIEDKIGPSLVCPDDMTILCSEPSDTSATGVPTLVGSGCTDADIFFNDAIVTNQCDGEYQSIINRSFYAVDAAGNRGPICTQVIFVERETLMSAILPPHWDGLDMHSGIQDNGVSSNPPLACDGAGTVYNTIEREDGRIVPSPYPDGDLIGTGFPGDVGLCGTIYAFYEDLIIDICEEDCDQSDNSYKVLRTWDLFDWCTGGTLIHQQIIKVVDTVAPVFQVGVPDLTVSTDLWSCGATIKLPTVVATDNCSEEITYTWAVSNGTYDAATNRVFIASPALTTPGQEIELIAYASDCCGNIAADTGLVTILDLLPPTVVADEHTVVTLNNQSEDGYTKVYAETFDDGSFDGCGPIDFWVRRMDRACEKFDGDPEGEIDEINDFHKVIHFCCQDLDEDQMIVFMVCDDGDGDGIPENNGDDNCNTAMVLVNVQDKLAPTINCPPRETINCIDFVAFADLLGKELTDEDISKLDARFKTAFSNSTCGVIDGQTFTGLDEVCGVGSAMRTFTVTTTNGQASCTQMISVVGNQDNLLSCDRISFEAGTPEDNANYDWCDPSDEVTPFVKTIQIFECGGTVINEPLIDRNGLCTEVGVNLTLDTFKFAGGGCIKILAHWEVIDQCFFDENFFVDDEVDPFVNENGYYELYVEYDIFDNAPPNLDCNDITVETTDCLLNDDVFTMTASDDCTADEFVSVTYKVDLGNDGVYEIPANGSAAEGNEFDASEIGGLPIGTHAIKWIAYDGCGNYATCHQEIEVVKQAKAPTPYCHLGLSSAVMDEEYGCSVEFWATDFAVDGFDDCDDSITVLMIPYQDIYGEPADLEDDLSVEEALAAAQANWVFGCEYIENGISHVVELRIYFVDEDGNFDFCDASLTLNDNFDCCEDLDLGGSSMIAGNIATSEGVILEDVNVSVTTDQPEFPRIGLTSKEGSFTFNNLPKSLNYSVVPGNDKNARKGVSTLDIVLIQRHILGIAELDSPYKIIAADINNNQKVNALDLLQLRKMILGLYSDGKFPNNTSWRFVDSEFKFTDAKRPFPYSEKRDVMNLSYDMYNQNFIGVKIGDVNGSYSASISDDAVRRSGQVKQITLEDKEFKRGEVITIELTSEDISNFYGFQFGLVYEESKLRFKGAEDGEVMIGESNLAVKDGRLLISWNDVELNHLDNGSTLLSLSFEAINTGVTSRSIKMDRSELDPEVYGDNLEVEPLDLTWRSAEAYGFKLLQNTPNPFNTRTEIAFILPEVGTAVFKVFDVTGKVVKELNRTFDKGINKIYLDNSELQSSGVYYYQLTYENESASRKMILLD